MKLQIADEARTETAVAAAGLDLRALREFPEHTVALRNGNVAARVLYEWLSLFTIANVVPSRRHPGFERFAE
jgi:hypothetical protein